MKLGRWLWLVWVCVAGSMRGAESRVEPLKLVPQHPPGFTKVASVHTGITFSNLLSVDRFTTNQIYLNGSGVTAGDVNGDGRPDVFLAGLGGRSTLYQNLGDWRFTNVTTASGLD